MPPHQATHSRGHGAARGMAASGVFAVMLVASISLWTAVPLGWLYVGSMVSDTQFPSQGPYAVVAIGILVSVVVVAWLIGRLNALYIAITGTNRLEPMRPTWLKSMRDSTAPAGSTTVVEAVLMGSVMIAGAVFVAWFFLLAGSPLPNQ